MRVFQTYRHFLPCLATALFVSILSSFVTYQLLKNKIPKIVTIDIAYLNNDFVMNLARHLSSNNMEDAEVQKVVKAYLEHLDLLIKDVQRGNFVLLQKQMVVSEVTDITKDMERALSESVAFTTQKEVSNADK